MQTFGTKKETRGSVITRGIIIYRLLFAEQYWNEPIKEKETDRACSTHGQDRKFLQYSG